MAKAATKTEMTAGGNKPAQIAPQKPAQIAPQSALPALEGAGGKAAVGSRWMLFFAAMLCFGLSLYAYSKLGLDSPALFKLTAFSQTMAKFASPTMVLFFLSYSLALALAAVAARGVGRLEAVIASTAASLFPAVAASFLAPAYSLPSVAFCVGIIFAAFFASPVGDEERTLSKSYAVVNRALLVLTVAAFFLAFFAVNGERDRYFGDMFTGLAGLAPAIITQGAGVLADVAQGYAVDRRMVEEVFPRDNVAAQLESSIPGFSSLNQSIKDAMIESTYDAVLVPQIENMKGSLADSMREYSRKPPRQLSASVMAKLREQVSQSEAYRQLYTLFPLGMAFIVVAVLSLFKIPVLLLATLLAYAGMKVL
jgi:hypothetical protein